MKDFFDKLSSYNFFNYFFPGILFCFISGKVSKYNFIQTDILSGLFLYYFVGIIISRVGSIVIEPIFKNSKIIKFSDYTSYVVASKKDDRIVLFSEINNAYRSLISLIVCLFAIAGFSWISNIIKLPNSLEFAFLGILLLVVLVLSYRKQSEYIKKRITALTEKE